MRKQNSATVRIKNISKKVEEQKQHLRGRLLHGILTLVQQFIMILMSLFIFFKQSINKHAPLRKLSRREKQLQAKPWITRGLLTSIKNKNRMFRKCYKCKDAKLIAQYKKYTNKLTRLRKTAKQQYYFKLFQKYRSDSKKTWKTINELYSTHQKLILIV